MTGLSGLFKAEDEEVDNSEKLVDLFRNRAELKKEFAALRNEKYQLQDRIKEHQGATARVQQKMDHLESLLLDPDWVHNVVAFYQLRRLGAHCNAQLARFAEHIKQQREQKVHGKTLDAWNAMRSGKSDAVRAKAGEVRLQVQLLEDQLQAEQHKMQTMGGIARLFRGRSQSDAVDEIAVNIETFKAEENGLLANLQNIENMQPPDHEGLDVTTKRSINFMIIAFAQQLYLHFEEHNLAAMAKEASEKSVGAVNYGSKYECDEIIENLNSRRESMESVTDYAEVLQKRARKLSDHALFRSDEDAVPVPGTVATIYSIDANGVVREKDANLLGDNYFAIAKILSR
ncbi:MAG: hypothetical protein K0U72_05080 [Gammaproteobacteria bacterium]|nr:hypothetical protein [Gammaproteobacteria bacterium]